MMSMLRIRRLLLAFIYLITGSLFGLLLLEGIVRSNATLLQRGMALPAPVDPPLTVQTYDVHYSDADALYWRPDLIRPIPTSENLLEARVTYETDEYGFRNHAPISHQVDIVVLGRSISLASHISEPWPDLLETRFNMRIFNLAQPGSGVNVKNILLERFGLPRHPQWVIIEVVPSIDILGKNKNQLLVSQQLFTPVIQKLFRRLINEQLVVTDNVIYPLRVDLPGREIDLTCCLHYLDFFSLDTKKLNHSLDWANYRNGLLKIIDLARSNNACVALLYVPTKPDVYFPLAHFPQQLTPALREVIPYQLSADGWIKHDHSSAISVSLIRNNVLVGHDLVENFARANDLLWIDPNDAMIKSVLEGQDPFMVYDSHWNQHGHKIVAEAVIESLNTATCP